MGKFKDLLAYKIAFDLATDIFEVSKTFPKEETYSLTDQIRKSSRSVCTNFAEAYRKRRYPAHFVSKISDSDGENSETEVWLDFAITCQYMSKEKYQKLIMKNAEVGKLLGDMMNNPGKYV